MSDPEKTASPRTCAVTARRAAKRVPGVARVDGCICEWLTGGVPGVTIRIEERGRLYVEIDVVAQLGQSLQPLGRAIKDAVATELKLLPGIHLMAVDIFFTGIRYDKRALPPRKEYST